jgi:glycosyltransferase involved in cell wall biosynthesis
MKKNNPPLVSVIMPMRNAETYVEQAVYSILSQSWKNLELIIIDDRSTDQSRKIVENISYNDSRVKLINGNAEGIAAAKNNGLQYATGQFVSFCDADDLFAECCIEHKINWLLQRPEFGAVCAQFAMMDCSGENIVNLDSKEDPCDITEELLSGQTRTHLCTFIIKRHVIEVIGGFREFFISAEDIDFQLRLAEVSKVFYVPELVYFYRLHDSSIVHTQSSSKREFFENTARVFRQQREQKGMDDLQLGHKLKVPVECGVPVDAKTQLQGALIGTAWRLHQNGQKLKAIKAGLNACRIKPNNFTIWKSFTMLFIK